MLIPIIDGGLVKMGNIPIFRQEYSAASVFVNWLESGIKTGKILTNSPGDMVHRVEEGLFLVSPAIFRACERDTGIKWDRSQREIQRKKINSKTETGQNIFGCEILSDNEHETKNMVIKGLLFHEPLECLGFDLCDKNELLRLLVEQKVTE